MKPELLNDMSAHYEKQASQMLKRVSADAAELAQEIERIINNPNYSQTFKASQAQTAIAHFTRNQMDTTGRAIQCAAQAEAFGRAAKEDN